MAWMFEDQEAENMRVYRARTPVEKDVYRKGYMSSYTRDMSALTRCMQAMGATPQDLHQIKTVEAGVQWLERRAVIHEKIVEIAKTFQGVYLKQSDLTKLSQLIENLD